MCCKTMQGVLRDNCNENIASFLKKKIWMFLNLSFTLLDQLISIAAIACQYSYYLSQKLEQISDKMHKIYWDTHHFQKSY